MIDILKPKIKTVAVCFSGECRTYNKCHESIKNFFESPGIDVKYFAHAWNSNSYKVNREDKVEVVDEYHDPNHIYNDMQNYFPFTKLKVEEKFPQVEPWDNLFYSEAMANLFKREYEFAHNMTFDVVVKCRFDLAFTPGSKFIDSIPLPAVHQKTLYSDMWVMTSEWYLPNIDDVFYFGTSLTMDLIAANLPYMVNRVYDELYEDINWSQNPYYKAGPGVNMYRWLTQKNIMTHRVLRPFMIYRRQHLPADPVKQYHELFNKHRRLW